MATLQFFPLETHSSKSFTFSARIDPSQQPDADASPDQTLEFRSTEIIQSGDTTVYRGVLVGLRTQELKAICKLAVDPRRSLFDCFETESRTYQTTLRDMQGHCIPEFYGLYDGTVKGYSAVCIILEDCGKSIYRFSHLQDEWLIKTIEILLAIHKRGLQHNNFGPENIVVDDVKNPTSIKLIDFQHCAPHKCQQKMQLGAYKLPPADPESFGCRELWLAAKGSRVWTPRNAEDLVKRVPEYGTRTQSFEEALRWAKADIKAWFDQWGHRADYIDGDAVLILEPAM
ncbi:hypothetical protein EIP86_006382 [Pleurotus ostreatoroseus]|nr:hypothetical protein EIP86_006382 [Pleurotus ostreatoroseus]